MTLHLVGETIDKARSHYGAQTGKLVQVMRGVYVDATDDIDAAVLRYAVRIARYLYPQAYLSAASANLLRPTRDGRLFLSGRRKQRTRIRALEIIQNEAPEHPSTGTAIIDDGLGEFTVTVSAIRQRFLEAFRQRSEHAASIDEDMRDTLTARLIEEYGNAKAVADAVWALARENSWHKEGALAERFLLHLPIVTPAENRAALDLTVAWHGKTIGHLRHDAFEWRWTPLAEAGPPLIRQTVPGRLPPFIVSLLPEGWLENVLHNQDERALLRSGKRYMSNITIVEQPSALGNVPSDVLLTRLEAHTKEGGFTGRYNGPGRSDIEENFERNLAKMFENADTPRLSGVQIKAPMHLDADGTLSPATGRPFTHILKPAGTSGYDGLPVVEWLAMRLGKAVGLEVPATALVAMPHGMPPALLVERFDIRERQDDQRLLALEDMCSVLDQAPQDKYKGTMERIARAIRPLSTSPDEDLSTLLKRALFAWLIADGDMHLKNIALLKTAAPGEAHFRTVRISPLYDAGTTRVFPRLKDDHLALKINGKDDRLRRVDFHMFAATAGMKAGEAETTIDEMLRRMNEATEMIALPSIPACGQEGESLAHQVRDLCRNRIQSLA